MKAARTELLIKPTMEECVKAAVALDMPEAEGRKFFYHYESNGWKVGKLAMKSFAGSMGGWRERWLERTGGVAPVSGNGHHRPAAMSGAVIMLKQKEYERILDRLKTIYRSYDSHNDLRTADRAEVAKLKKRREELKRDLGIVI